MLEDENTPPSIFTYPGYLGGFRSVTLGARGYKNTYCREEKGRGGTSGSSREGGPGPPARRGRGAPGAADRCRRPGAPPPRPRGQCRPITYCPGGRGVAFQMRVAAKVFGTAIGIFQAAGREGWGRGCGRAGVCFDPERKPNQWKDLTCSPSRLTSGGEGSSHWTNGWDGASAAVGSAAAVGVARSVGRGVAGSRLDDGTRRRPSMAAIFVCLVGTYESSKFKLYRSIFVWHNKTNCALKTRFSFKKGRAHCGVCRQTKTGARALGWEAFLKMQLSTFNLQ